MSDDFQRDALAPLMCPRHDCESTRHALNQLRVENKHLRAEIERLQREREAHKPRTVTHIPDSSGLTLPQLEAGKQALYSCSEDPSFDDVRKVIAAVAQSNPTK